MKTNPNGSRGTSTLPVPCDKPDMRLHTATSNPTKRDRSRPRPEVTRWKTKAGKVIENDLSTGLKTCWFECSECHDWFMVQRSAAIKAAWPSQCSQVCRDAAQRRINRKAQQRRRQKAKTKGYVVNTFNPDDWGVPDAEARRIVKRGSGASPEARKQAQTYLDAQDHDPRYDADGELIKWPDEPTNVPPHIAAQIAANDAKRKQRRAY